MQAYFAFLIDQFIASRSTANRSEKTMKNHRNRLVAFATWWAERGYPDDPEDWTRAMIEKYFIDLRTRPSARGDKKLSANSVVSYATSVRAFLNWLVKYEHTTTKFTALIDKPQPSAKRKLPFTKQEVSTLLLEASRTRNGLRDYALLLFLLDTGCRLGDVTRLKLADVDLTRFTATFFDGKGRKDRDVPFSGDTAKALRRYLSKGRRKVDGDTLFLTEEGTAMRDQGVYHIIKRVGAAAGVRDCHPHRFRHTAAYAYVRGGGNVLSLKLILGHSDLKTTERYVTLLIDDLVEEHRDHSPLKLLLA